MIPLRLRSGQAARAVLALAVLGALACGRAEERNTAPPPAVAPDSSSAKAPPGVILVPHEKLATLVPVLDGWTREAIQTATVSLPAPAAHATVAYTRGKARIDLEITDTGGHPDYVGSLAKVAGTTFNQKAANGYLKGTTIGWHPATESWNHVDRLGDVSVLIARRMIVHATGTGLTSIGTLRSLVEKVDPARLK
jgi:hypothetical protein